MINEHTLEDTLSFFISVFNTNCMQIIWLLVFIRMKTGLLVRMSNCYKYDYCLGLIVWLSAYTNCCLFPQQQLSQLQQLPAVTAATHACTIYLTILGISVLVCYTYATYMCYACYTDQWSAVSNRCGLNLSSSFTGCGEGLLSLSDAECGTSQLHEIL